MAVSWRRWVLGIGLGWLALMAALLPPRASESLLLYAPWAWVSPYFFRGPPNPVDPLVQKRNRLSQAVRRASRDWLVLSWRDSIMADRSLIARSRGRDPEMVVRAPVPVQRLAALRLAVAARWQSLPRRNPAGWTVVVVIPDSVARPGGPGNGRFIPNERFALFAPLLDEDGCIVLIPAGAVSGNDSRRTVIDALAPCTWRAAFGPPSPVISGWLARSDWTIADGVDWEHGGAPQYRRPNYIYFTDVMESPLYPSREEYAGRIASMLKHDGQIDAAACLSGRSEACGRYLTAPIQFAGRRDLAGVWSPGRGGWGAAVIKVGFLASMLQEVGPDKFQAFWTTSAPFDSAFQSTVGVPLSKWTQDLLEARLGRAGEREIRLSSTLASLLVGLGLVAIILGTSSRRTVR